MRVLIVYYSRSGMNRKIAEELQKLLGSDIEGLVDLTNRSGILGFIFGGRDAFLKRTTRIRPVEKKPEDYDLMVICTPVWAGTISPAVRTYLKESGGNIKNFAFLSVSGSGEGNIAALHHIEALLNKKAVASLLLKDREVVRELYREKLVNFARDIRE